MRETHSISNLCFLLCGFLLLAGWNDSFQPLQKNDKYYFSIYGYLDASADTQWVRISSARQTIDNLPNPPGIRVILEDFQSGETVVINNSVFTSRNVHNYWTTIVIRFQEEFDFLLLT